MSGDLAMVHNGIIENYQVLKEQLIEKGYEFKSTTDTEVLVQLIDFYYQQNGKDLVSAVCQALNGAIGAYAIAVVEKEHPSHLVAARQSSPLVVGRIIWTSISPVMRLLSWSIRIRWCIWKMVRLLTSG